MPVACFPLPDGRIPRKFNTHPRTVQNDSVSNQTYSSCQTALFCRLRCGEFMYDMRWLPYLARVFALAATGLINEVLARAHRYGGCLRAPRIAHTTVAASAQHGTLRLTRRPPALCNAVESFARGLVQCLRLGSHARWWAPPNGCPIKRSRRLPLPCLS